MRFRISYVFLVPFLGLAVGCCTIIGLERDATVQARADRRAAERWCALHTPDAAECMANYWE